VIGSLEPLLSEEGWPYASLPPQEPGDPGRFHALFGRDSLITALQVLPEAPEVARATLRALAAQQGRVDDAETDEEPGKILHEYRPVAEPRFAEAGWPVRDGTLLYYGSADATSWFLVVLHALGDAALPGVTELVPAARTVLVRFDPRSIDADALAALSVVTALAVGLIAYEAIRFAEARARVRAH
jgi:glycogen debranching enzyme